MLPITIGVPQGSVLGLFLFLVYINDLPNSCDSEVQLYAIDAVLLCKDETHDRLKSKREKEIESWVISYKLTINYTKTNCVLKFFLFNECQTKTIGFRVSTSNLGHLHG